MLLDKYCPLERIDVLQSGLIAYSEPLVFNDPFEFELILSHPSLGHGRGRAFSA